MKFVWFALIACWLAFVNRRAWRKGWLVILALAAAAASMAYLPVGVIYLTSVLFASNAA